MGVRGKTGHDTWCHGVVDREVFSLRLDLMISVVFPALLVLCDSSGDLINIFFQKQGACLWPGCPCTLAMPQPEELSIMLQMGHLRSSSNSFSLTH